MKRWLVGAPVKDFIPSVGLLLFRIVFGGFMLVGHGWGKLMSFSEKAATFPDPLGIGNQLSMGSAIFCEVICAALVVLGLATRFAVLPLVFTMVIAAFAVHGGDPSGVGLIEPESLVRLYEGHDHAGLFTALIERGLLSFDGLDLQGDVGAAGQVFYGQELTVPG